MARVCFRRGQRDLRCRAARSAWTSCSAWPAAFFSCTRVAGPLRGAGITRFRSARVAGAFGCARVAGSASFLCGAWVRRRETRHNAFAAVGSRCGATRAAGTTSAARPAGPLRTAGSAGPTPLFRRAGIAGAFGCARVTSALRRARITRFPGSTRITAAFSGAWIAALLRNLLGRARLRHFADGRQCEACGDRDRDDGRAEHPRFHRFHRLILRCQVGCVMVFSPVAQGSFPLQFPRRYQSRLERPNDIGSILRERRPHGPSPGAVSGRPGIRRLRISGFSDQTGLARSSGGAGKCASGACGSPAVRRGPIFRYRVRRIRRRHRPPCTDA